jgi:hypothetical protein
MPGYEFVGNDAGEASVPALAIKAQQMVAIFIAFVDPQFADHAAVGQRVVHV